MRQRTLGHSDLTVSEMGLGCMGMSAAYGERNNEGSVATIHRARDLGVNFLDSADLAIGPTLTLGGDPIDPLTSATNTEIVVDVTGFPSGDYLLVVERFGEPSVKRVDTAAAT